MSLSSEALYGRAGSLTSILNADTHTAWLLCRNPGKKNCIRILDYQFLEDIEYKINNLDSSGAEWLKDRKVEK